MYFISKTVQLSLKTQYIYIKFLKKIRYRKKAYIRRKSTDQGDFIIFYYIITMDFQVKKKLL